MKRLILLLLLISGQIIYAQNPDFDIIDIRRETIEFYNKELSKIYPEPDQKVIANQTGNSLTFTLFYKLNTIVRGELDQSSIKDMKGLFYSIMSMFVCRNEEFTNLLKVNKYDAVIFKAQYMFRNTDIVKTFYINTDEFYKLGNYYTELDFIQIVRRF